ncbi:MAG: RimK family alpha-L-glutamate ligase [Anaerolineae bacterium]
MASKNGQQANGRRLAIFYEHPEWFKPMFAELDRRGVPYDRLLAYRHHFDPAEQRSPYALVVNRMSPSAYMRGHAQAINYTLQFLAYLKMIGANVLNGYDAYVYEFSKARQLALLEKLGLRYPRARVVNHISQINPAAEGLVFPVVVKPNIGGSGAGIQKFDAPADLAEAAETGRIDLGLDHLALVQEYLPPRGNSIVRMEVLNGRFLYAIRLHLKSPDTFNLCPADYCDLPDNGMPDGVSGRDLLVEGYTPPKAVIEAVERLTAVANIEVGGVEYLINDRDGEVYYYDVNALSNFVADAPEVVGFDPFPRLVDFLLARAGLAVPA